ncbi:uncharacterized protein LAJ45_00953 [Morchella importuna]|uniref:uncharacterized protein n=1 Tax=Morchella importuna TaxID=1174673 RepID=UPI001E8DF092|nr:uncharacterized protein LAJ45_00953 [Morchella importuna]KAH8154426.1 hypothetical protein LAJ45_00953 [Morchella importuna]
MLFAVLQVFVLMALSAAAASTPVAGLYPRLPIVTSVSFESLVEDERAYKDGSMSEERAREEVTKNERYNKVGKERGGLTPGDGQASSATTLGTVSLGGIVAVGVGLNLIY